MAAVSSRVFICLLLCALVTPTLQGPTDPCFVLMGEISAGDEVRVQDQNGHYMLATQDPFFDTNNGVVRTTDNFDAATVFEVVPANSGDAGAYSFLVKGTNNFIRHFLFELLANHVNDDDTLYRKDSSFKPVPGSQAGFVFLHSVNYAARYIGPDVQYGNSYGIPEYLPYNFRFAVNVCKKLSITQIDSFRAGACHPISFSPAGPKVTLSVFNEEATCTFYSDANCNSELVQPYIAASTVNTVFATCHMTNYQKIKISAGGVTILSNPFQVIGVAGIGAVCGDPHFEGLDGRDIDFTGKIGQTYNVFSDPYVSVNTRFDNAYGANPYVTSTINGAIGIRMRGFNISMDSHTGFDKVTQVASIVINGETREISEKADIVLSEDCIALSIEKDASVKHHHHTVMLATQEFSVYIYLSEDHNKYINTTYFDFYIAADFSNPAVLGGILGKTANKYTVDEILDNEDLYLVDDGMFGVGKEGKYQGLPVCKKQGKRDTAQVGQCKNVLPNGYRCKNDANCAGGLCDKRGVCAPTNACLLDSDCASNSCDDGLCVQIPAPIVD